MAIKSNSVFNYYAGQDPNMKYTRNAVPSGAKVPVNTKNVQNAK